MRASRLAALGLLVLASSSASAHVGNVPAKALFHLPAPPALVPDGDGGTRWSWTVAEADQHYLLAWEDGDNDPTGRFTFRYVDHVLPTAASAEYVDALTVDGKPTGGQPLGTVVVDTDGREAAGIYVGCACEREDAAFVRLDGAAPPQCFDGGARRCDNAVDWDTSRVPDGVYWIYAVNTDPPFHIFNVSEAPVRVRHGQKRFPAAIVVRPGAAGATADRSYRGNLLLDGSGVLSIDLRYGANDPDHWQDPLQPITSGPATARLADGSFAFDWDTAAVPEGTWFVDLVVTDDSGASSRAASRNGMTVAHRPDMAHVDRLDLGGDGVELGAPSGDLSASVDGGSGGGTGCGCRIGSPSAPDEPGGRGGGLAALLVVAAAARLSRRGPRRGSRSGCTR